MNILAALDDPKLFALLMNADLQTVECGAGPDGWWQGSEMA